MKISDIKITGSGNCILHNKLFQPGSGSRGLAVIFPGAGYTCDMPALYYPRKVLLGRGFDVLAVEYAFQGRGETFDPGLIDSVLTDGVKILEWVFQQSGYDHYILAGKSLGTRLLSHLLPAYPALEKARALYLTPVFSQGFNQATARVTQESLMVIGDRDPFYQPALIQALERQKDFQLVVLEGADHGLEVPGDYKKSLQHLELICREVHKFSRQH